MDYFIRACSDLFTVNSQQRQAVETDTRKVVNTRNVDCSDQSSFPALKAPLVSVYSIV